MSVRFQTEHPWSRNEAWARLFVLVVGLGFTFFTLSRGLTDGDALEVTSTVLFGAGLLLTLGGLTAIPYLVNRAIFTIDDEGLTIVHAPIPWPGKRFKREDIDQLFTKRIELKTSMSGGGGRVFYNVVLRLTSGKQVTLMRGFSFDIEGQELEDRLESALNIEDHWVDGEAEKSWRD